jgi:replication initiation protein RepC
MIVAPVHYLRPFLGANESVWIEAEAEAEAEIGLVRAAVTVIYVLQLYDDDVSSGEGRIQNPGGYFRAMVLGQSRQDRLGR